MTPSWSKNGLLSAASFVFRNYCSEFATLYLLLCGQAVDFYEAKTKLYETIGHSYSKIINTLTSAL